MAMPRDIYVPAWRPDGNRLVWLEHLASADKREALRNALVSCEGWDPRFPSAQRKHYFRWRRSGGAIVRCRLAPTRKVR